MNYKETKPYNHSTTSMLPDTQAQEDYRDIKLQQVGIRNLLYPMRIRSQSGALVQIPAKLELSVNLPAEKRGTHMSRFLEIINRNQKEVSIQTLPLILDDMIETLDADNAYFRMIYTSFLEKTAPVSHLKSFLGYQSILIGEKDEKQSRISAGIRIPVKSLCPCSKEISDYGAHNQRSTVAIAVQLTPECQIQSTAISSEYLATIAEASASASLHPLLKREDERFVTMQAYNNPVFVEDLIRNVAIKLKRDDRIQTIRIKVVNHESIHQHDAFAIFRWKRK